MEQQDAAPSSSPKYLRQSVPILLQLLDNSMSQVIDFFDIVKFLSAADDNFPGLETTEIEKIRNPSFTGIKEERLNDLPYSLRINRFFCCEFFVAAWPWSRIFS